MLHLKIVVEPSGHGRPEGQLDAVEQPHDCPGHQVRTRVTQQVQRLGIFAGNQAKSDLTIGRQRIVNPYQISVNLGSQRGFGQTRANIGGNVDRSNVV